jgi:NAD(P)-dependent dehydrogenase (short-subunit alcohol dehydrogenase family)
LNEQASRNAQDIRRAGSARYGKPENIADVVAFLASDGAAHVNGAAWVVDDGITAG